MRSNGSVRASEVSEAPFARLLHPATQHERLLDAMAQTVSRRGYAATSVADVLRVARISRRTFYELFVDKEHCFLAAYDAIASVCAEHVATAYGAEAEWQDAVAAALNAFLEVLAAEPDFARLAIVEVLGAGPRAIARRDELLSRFTELFDDARLRADGAVAPPPLVAQAITGGIHELIYSRLVRGEARELPALGEELRHYAFMLLGVEPRES